MKTTLSRQLRNAILCLVLLASAIPFAAKTQAGAEEEPPDVVITIKAELAGDVEFVFKEYKIFYESDGLSDPPTDATVNGIPWPDPKKPFEMGFTPEFSSAKLYAKSERVNAEVSAGNDRITVSVNVPAVSPAPYQVSVAMRRQGNAAPKADAEASKEVTLMPKADASADASKEVTLMFEANVEERGFFVFTEDRIEYRPNGSRQVDPSDVTIDGKPWEDLKKPFRLGFTPDFGKAAIVEKEGRGTIEILALPKYIGLVIYDEEKTLSPYRVKIAMKKQTPLEGRSRASDAQQSERKAAPAKKWVRDASSSGEILLKLEGNLNGRGVFLFDGDTITYRHESEAEYPKHVTIDDMPWDDLTKPFKLDYATEAPKAVITSRNGPNTVKLRKSDGKFMIEIDDSVYTWPSYRIVVASRHQADRKSITLRDLPIQRPPSDFGMPAMTGFPSMDMNGLPKSGRPAFDESSWGRPKKESPYKNDPDAPAFNRRYNSFGQIDRSTPEGIWEEGIRQRKIVLTGQFFGNGTFSFEGDTISYRHETREYPSGVTINEAIWGMPDKPFKLPFRIETVNFELNQTKGDRPAKLTKIGDERFAVFFKDPESPPGSSECFYSITITPKKTSASAEK